MMLTDTVLAEPILVAEIEKTKSQVIRVTLGIYAGRSLLSIRTFYQKDDEWLPSKSGIAVPLDLLPQFADAVAAARATAEKAVRGVL